MRITNTLILAGLILAIVLMSLTGLAAAQNTACYGEQGGGSVVAGSGCTYSFLSGSRIVEKPNTLVLANGGVISNSYGVVAVTLTAAATATITTTGYVSGDRLKFYNPTTYTLTIADSAPVYASGNIALGQYDWAELWFNGSGWVQTGESDN